MKQPRFRNPKYGVLPIRDLIRGNTWVDFSDAPYSLDVEDVDLWLRWYDPRTFEHTFAIAELKEAFGDRWDMTAHEVLTMSRSKSVMYRTFDSSLDQNPDYRGFFLIRYSDDDHNENTRYIVNDTKLSAHQFADWVKGRTDIPRHRWSWQNHHTPGDTP